VGCGREGDLQMNTHKNSKTSIDDWFVGGIAGTRKIEHSSIKYCTYATIRDACLVLLFSAFGYLGIS
jgi:hypothetical protein